MLRQVIVCLLMAPLVLPAETPDAALNAFLRNYLGQLQPDEVPTFQRAFVDLNGDGKNEAIVYFTDRWSCGSGGCNMLILTPNRNSYRLVTRTTITQLPVRLLTTTTNGWRDLSVGVRGGGISPGYEARLRFNGRKYPSNPSVPPAIALTGNASGKVLISDSSDSLSLSSRP